MAVRISVALCTFNGQMYLADQLRSLDLQARPPDELIVRDDGSNDSTLQMLRQFAASAQFPVSIKLNETNQGPAKNFDRAIADCTGEVIALCDQDDVWEPEKLAVIESAFISDRSLGAFFSDARMCDADGTDLGYRLWSSVGLKGRSQRKINSGHAFDVILRQNVVTGATLAFASRFRPLILPIDPPWMHDGWIALLIAAHATVHAEPRPLIRYRQHAGQNIGAARRSLIQQYRNARMMDRTVFAEQAEMYTAALNRLETGPRPESGASGFADHPTTEDLDKLAEKIRHYQRRSAIRLGDSSRLRSSVTELLSRRYGRFSLGWKSFAQDLFYNR